MTDKLQSILQAEGLEHLLPTLVDQGVVDSMLSDLSESDLKSLGVDKLGERKRLLTALTATRSANEAKSAPANSSEDGAKKSAQKNPDTSKSVRPEPVSAEEPKQKKTPAQSTGEKAITKSEPPPSKPESKLVLFFLVFFMGPIPLFFLSWKRAVLSILILIISLGIPMSPLM
ncbi:MAG: SAM domain-containing protein, partial [Pseudomonadota bacterium]